MNNQKNTRLINLLEQFYRLVIAKDFIFLIKL